MIILEKYRVKLNFLVQIFGYYKLIQIIINCFMNYKFFVKKIPFVQSRINNKRLEIISNIKENFEKQTSHIPKFLKLPNTGISKDNILKLFDITVSKIETLRRKSIKLYTYSNNDELDSLMNGLFPYFNKSNHFIQISFHLLERWSRNVLKL